jgi:hypothetical protein
VFFSLTKNGQDLAKPKMFYCLFDLPKKPRATEKKITGPAVYYSKYAYHTWKWNFTEKILAAMVFSSQ